MSDIDELLDGAMDELNELDMRQEADKVAREARLQEEVQRKREEAAAAANNTSSPMAAIQEALASLTNGGSDSSPNPEESIEKLMGLAQSLIGALEGEDLSEADRQQVKNFKNLVTAIENDDEDTANELVKELDNTPMEAGEVNETMKTMLNDLKNLTEQSTTDGAPPAGEASSTTPDIPVDFLMSILTNPDLATTLKLELSAYEGWLAAKKDELTEERKASITAQRDKVAEIVDFLAVPVDKDDGDRQVQLVELLHQRATLGDAPDDLRLFVKTSKEAE